MGAGKIGGSVPYVNVKITPDGVTRAKKKQLVAEITDVLVRLLNKKPEQTHIVIDVVETDNWGFAGMLTTDYRRMKAAKVPGSRSRGPSGSRRRV